LATLRAYLLFKLLIGISFRLIGQGFASNYPFIDTTASKFQYNNSLIANQLYQKWQNRYTQRFVLVEYGSEEVIVSQRNNLSWYQKTGISPGIFFPSTFLGSNHPSVFPNSHSGNWTYATMAEPYPIIKPGICGYAARSEDDKNASIKISIPVELKKTSNRLRIYCERSEQSFDVIISTSNGSKKTGTIFSTKSDQLLPFIEFPISTGLEWVQIQLVKSNSKQKWFTLYGISVENSESPIWHAIGVRGITLTKIQSNDGFLMQLQKFNPSAFWFDGLTQDFFRGGINSDIKKDLTYYLQSVKRFLPKTEIIVTIPQELSKNNEPIYRVNQFANEFRIPLNKGISSEWLIWDWNRISGGQNSSFYWIDSGLMKSNGFQLTTTGISIKSHTAALAFQEFISKVPAKFKILPPIDSTKLLKRPLKDTIQAKPMVRETWKYHTVKYGETAYRIATRYSISPNELKTWNNLSGYYIYPGQKLKVGKVIEVIQPVLKEPLEKNDSLDIQLNQPIQAETKKTPPTTSVRSPIVVNPAFPNNSSSEPVNSKTNTEDSTVTAKSSTQTKTTPKYHRVQANETLYSISKQYGVTVDQIKKLNRLSNNNISVGRVLRIW